MSSRPAATRRILPGSPFNAPPRPPVLPLHFEVDDLVSHDRHGLGKVLRIESETSVVVDFRDGNVRRMPLPDTKLSKL
jgi:hypothetical protein